MEEGDHIYIYYPHTYIPPRMSTHILTSIYGRESDHIYRYYTHTTPPPTDPREILAVQRLRHEGCVFKAIVQKQNKQ